MHGVHLEETRKDPIEVQASSLAIHLVLDHRHHLNRVEAPGRSLEIGVVAPNKTF